MSTASWWYDRSPSFIKELVSIRRYKALRASYRATFPGLRYRLFWPSDERLEEWWRDYVLFNKARHDTMRDGWLSGVEYWDGC